MENNEKLLSAIFNIGRLIKEKIHSSSCLADFTHEEIEVLKFVKKNKNTTMRAVADYLYIKPPSATSVIENLVKKGILKRVLNKGDRRVVYVLLTPKGLKLLQKKYKSIHKAIGKIFEKLNEKDKKNLIKIFEKIHEKNI
ncbi:MAG: MarR family transcriptional regulator [Candidatus Staskawiczbacteria bacterium]|nr:MarR family transcriptional regulator [Candidatus Staskawiczbacteria bacterium]